MMKSNYKISLNLIKRTNKVASSTGYKFVLIYALKRCLGVLLEKTYNSHYSQLHQQSNHIQFSFLNENLEYFNHPYGYTSENERAIEVPIVKKLANLSPKLESLEIGNVLNHYGCFNHKVVDKYELKSNVENIDVIDINYNQKFDVIFSISTLEHVGLDEKIKQPEKSIQAIKLLSKLLKPKGKMIITLPFNYNNTLQKYLLNNFPAKKYFFQKINSDNCWKACTQTQALQRRYGFPYVCANAIGIFEYIHQSK